MSAPSIPIGSIVAYCGPVATDADKENLKALGWLLCDGTLYNKKDYIDLFLAIGSSFGGSGGGNGSFNVPDLRGRFLRGTAHHSTIDPDVLSRLPSNSGGAVGNAVGSLQYSATALPKTAFITASAGKHQHNVSHAPVTNNAYAVVGDHYGKWAEGLTTIEGAGNHSHILDSGWDSESRPINLYVNFLIKFQDI